MSEKLISAAIERFDGNIAIIETADGVEYRVHKSQLPEGCHVGHHLQMTISDEELIQVTIDEEATMQAKKDIGELMDKLRRSEHLKKD